MFRCLRLPSGTRATAAVETGLEIPGNGFATDRRGEDLFLPRVHAPARGSSHFREE